MGLAYIHFWLRSLLEAPKWVKDSGNGPQMTVAYLDRTFCIDMCMNVTPCCALAAGSNYQFDTGEVLRPREREGPSAGASPNSPTHLLL